MEDLRWQENELVNLKRSNRNHPTRKVDGKQCQAYQLCNDCPKGRERGAKGGKVKEIWHKIDEKY